MSRFYPPSLVLALAVCVSHYAPNAYLTRTHPNKAFLDTNGGFFRKAVKAAFGPNVPYHDFSPLSPFRVGKTIGESESVRQAVFSALHRETAPCPWSLHKLRPEDAEMVYGAARRCV